MKSWRLALLALASCALWSPGAAHAQRRTVNGFETNCAGQDVGGVYLLGFEDFPANLYAACGISSVITGESNNARIARSGILFGVPNVVGRNALVGAYSVMNPSNITINFAPAVNELAFQALGIERANALQVRAFDGANTQLFDEAAPAPAGGVVNYARTSSVAISRVVISYTQPGGLLVDSWFIDALTFNAWACGDGEVENGANETCDDGNRVQCDGCSNSCRPSVVGCFDGNACLAPGGGSGCNVCDTSQAPSPGGDIMTIARPAGTACDDGLKCTLGEMCDAAGRCLGPQRNCDDGITCTSDTCSESAAADGCVHTLGARDCLIDGTCFSDRSANPQNACELCDPARSPSAWSPQATDVRCGSPSCIGGQFTPAALCDGAGTCTTPTPVSCGEFACATPLSCTETCSNDRECGTTSHCDLTMMKCVPNLPQGASCMRSAQCANGFSCSDGVCCDAACGSKCETCRSQAFPGKCVNITFGDPENECPEGSSCRSGNQCVSDMQPNQSGSLPIGAACDRDDVCSNGLCRDSVCCDRACDGACEGCNVLGASPGQCTPYSLGSDPQEECAGLGGVCNGQSACTRYETRGNGLCSASPGTQNDARGSSAFGALAALSLLLVLRRRRQPR